MNRIGNYRIERALGSNGTSAMYAASHIVLPRPAVVKVAHAAIAWCKAFQIKALREPYMLEALRHPGVVRVFESGVLDDRRPWFAHEHVDGIALSDVVGKSKLAPRVVAELVRDLAGVLAHAHRRGIIVGGLRPASILLTPHSRGFPVCLVDFSDARPHDAKEAVPHVPTPGSRHYIAPELARGELIDDRADMYALGVIAYHALTGKLPYESAPIATLSETGGSHVPAAARCPDAPLELSTMIDQMLAANRWDRPSSADVHSDLTFLCDALASEPVIRRPRWTPPTPYAALRTDVVGGEIPRKRAGS
jgi:serine/threonine-protein kinase